MVINANFSWMQLDALPFRMHNLALREALNKSSFRTSDFNVLRHHAFFPLESA